MKISKQHLEFIPSKDAINIIPSIFVFSAKLNNRIYKKKRWYIGRIMFHNDQPYFAPAQDYVALGCDTIDVLSKFMNCLYSKSIVFDLKEGDFKNE